MPLTIRTSAALHDSAQYSIRTVTFESDVIQMATMKDRARTGKSKLFCSIQKNCNSLFNLKPRLFLNLLLLKQGQSVSAYKS